ncbi:MAG TPA: citrate (Si)-synthase [Cytophagales bacterium]|jgi:citrate synthase|nr:citrate (Si)-synthase [Cytophagales bacterium]
MTKFAELSIDGKTYQLPVVVGSENEVAVDISNLRAESGIITLDTGYKNTGSTKSAITFLDGEKGILRYRGYPIEGLASKSSFLEVAYLLIYGELPKEDELVKFRQDIKNNQMCHEDTKKIMEGFPSNSHPMGILSSLATSLTAFFPESLDPNRSWDKVKLTIIRLLAKIPTMVAWSYTKQKGLPANYPDNTLKYVDNFLKMMFSQPTAPFEVDPVISDAMEKIFILHADHEQNCSTSTVRFVGSSQASLYASIAAGINALWGPLHGGANQAVIEMLTGIEEDGGDIDKYIAKAKDKDDPFRLMGFGHRVYKNFDPRARILKKNADAILDKLGIQDKMLEIAKKLEEHALEDDYFVERKLYPNVDFYSGIIMNAIGIPTNMFPVMFSIGRLPGWIAQWKEMRENKEPIGRPRQIYVGANERAYVDFKNR